MKVNIAAWPFVQVITCYRTIRGLPSNDQVV